MKTLKALKPILVGMCSVALFAALFALPAFADDTVGKAADATSEASEAADAAATDEAAGAGSATGSGVAVVTDPSGTYSYAVRTQAQTGTYVFDEYGVLSSSQFQTLEQMGADYASKYGIGTYLVFCDTMNGNMNPTSSQRNEFARQYFLNNSLGVGSGKSGIIVVVAVQSRDYVTVKHFSDSDADPFSNECVDALEEKYTSYLSDNDWYGGAKAYYDLAGEQMEYFAATGKQWTEPDPVGLIIKVLAALGIPALVARSSVRRDKAAMQTAREKHEANDYLDQNSLALSVATDQFVNTTLAVAPIPKNDDSDSGGGWSDMGGGFSGSGGGKF